jgi:hypothetical protein
MRRAVALLITLSVIAVMISLLGVLFRYLDRAREEALSHSALIEGDILYNDFSRALKEGIGGSPSLETLSTFYSSPIAISAENGEFDLTFYCEPAFNRIPLSWLGKRDEKGYRRYYELASSLFDRLASDAGLRDSGKFRELLEKQLSGESDRQFSVDSRLGGKKDIMTKRKFRELMDEYRFAEDDENIYRVEWERYFSFTDSPKEPKSSIDGEFITPQLLAFISDMDESLVEESFKEGELKNFFDSVGEDMKSYEWLFSKKASANMKCTARYGYNDNYYTISFDYRAGWSKGFEFVREEK